LLSEDCCDFASVVHLVSFGSLCGEGREDSDNKVDDEVNMMDIEYHTIRRKAQKKQ